MADVIDRAQEIDERIRESREAARLAKQPRGESYTHCLECGREIPEERRLAVPGVELCVPCQEETERRRP
jgi:phage/conjugal plasmid C-4 type zinc finger TraR family protein